MFINPPLDGSIIKGSVVERGRNKGEAGLDKDYIRFCL